ncbi:DUF4179 domain-containing protein [Romboutsia weinsteinii]|nr:DUF4179 domain-containing protein [Romboutsia weinsteinii]
MSEKYIRDNIEIPNKLDDYILKGIERGREEKIFVKKRNRLNTVVKVSSILIVGTLGLGIINPEIVRAIPIIGRVLDGFESSNFGTPVDKYVKYAEGVGIVSENKKATVTLNEVIVDENICMFGFTIESDALKGYEGKNSGDFINIDQEITIDGKSIDTIGHRARKIDDRTGALVLTANIAELKLKGNVKVDIKINSINGTKKVRGNWEFNIETNKVKGSNRININQNYDIKGNNLIIDEIVTSPLSTTVMLSGVDDIENPTIFGSDYKVIDDNNNLLKSSVVSMSMDNTTGEISGKLEIFNDTSNTRYIQLIPNWGRDVIEKEVEGIYVNLLTTTGSGEREEVLISREPTKEEKKNGYALSKVYYYINMDKEREFLSLEELKDYEIQVNNTDKVKIKDIEVGKNNTKITMKVYGNYDHLSQLVLFDEDMNDVAAWEGHIGAVLEDEKEGIYSITFDKIDTSKKYKIAIPMTKDIDLNSKDKIRINLEQNN